jgi:hypothetical protein
MHNNTVIIGGELENKKLTILIEILLTCHSQAIMGVAKQIPTLFFAPYCTIMSGGYYYSEANIQ